jgi:hypothetical protein
MEKIKVQKLFHLKNCPPKSHRVRSSSTSSPIKKKTKEKVVPFTVNRNVTEGGGGGRKKQQQKSSVVLGYYL